MKFKEWLTEDMSQIQSNEPSTPGPEDGGMPSDDTRSRDEDDGEEDINNPMKSSKPTSAYPQLTAKMKKMKKR